MPISGHPPLLLLEGDDSQSLDGVLFSKAPTFPQGAISSGTDLTGTLFQKAPTFFTGDVSGIQALTGTLFAKAPVFPTGVVSTNEQELTGTLFVKSPTFPLGVVSVSGGGVEVPRSFVGKTLVEVWSLPDDPGGFRLLCEPPWLEGTGFQDRFDVYGGGRLVVASDYEHLGLIIDVDPSSVETSRSSLIRGFQIVDDDESPGGATKNCVWEFFADQVDEAIQGGQAVTIISGLDIRSAPDDGIVYPLTPEIPHWQWGQKTIIPNSGFEEGGLTSHKFQLEVNATAGTYTITVGTFGTTAAINWDANVADVAIAIEALDPSIDLDISGAGTPENPFIFEFLSPAETDIGTISTDSGGLTGLASVFILAVGGQSIFAPWTRSFHPTIGLYHGTYNFFRIDSEQVHSGSFALHVDADLGDWPASYPGAQVIQSVSAGQHYAWVWVYPEHAARYRFVIRTTDETFIAAVEADLVADTWQQMSILAFDIPEHVDQVIFRIACIANVHGVQEFWVDDAVLAPGFPPTTWGDILSTLMNEAFTRGSLSWLDLGFDAVFDSDGNSWDTAELEFTADALMELGTHVIGDGEAAGYEHDLVPLDPPAGGKTHQLLAFNPDGRGQVVTDHPAIVLGAFTSGRIAKRRMPYTHLLLELNDGTHVEMTDARLATFPRRERGVRVEQANDEATAEKIGQAIFDKEVANLLATQVTLDGESVVPYRDFDIGWHVPYSLGSRAAKHDRRIHVIASNFSNDRWTYVVTASSHFADRDEMVLENLRMLNAEFLRKRPRGKEGPAFVPVGAGTFSVFSLPGQAFVEVGRLRLNFPLPAYLIGVKAACNVAPTGAGIVVDVNKNGSSVYTGPDQRPTIAAGTFASAEMFPSVSIINPGDYITVDIDQVGSTLPGGDVTVMVRWNWGVIA